ncbi:tryptophan 2,3-dioxygenase family protein [Larkinella sp. VNQ87]|uniref:tryptophan 2,3-dioxygenase family protein n=1 Tax=Larkinella sp. VNQ87 TaxID=3400921 RepID=UPI003C041810
MTNETLPADLTDKLHQLAEKYAAMGQDLSAYLEGLLQADYLTYWDYIHLETLLSLQNPRTAYPDELIFITYHQSTELYFKLILHEVHQIAYHPALTAQFFAERLQRINRYFELLENSYAVMIDGMEKEQFLKFRMALLPSSGFQSVQFREIEIVSTDFVRLLAGDFPAKTDPEQSVANWFPFLYWLAGATELATQQKTLTLKQFESHYTDRLIRLADEYRSRNLWQRFLQVRQTGEETDALIAQLREYDHRLNVRWKSLHLRSAMRYLHRNTDEIKTTGGTNWQKYLPPREQKRIFYPELWSETEQREWGRMNRS